MTVTSDLSTMRHERNAMPCPWQLRVLLAALTPVVRGTAVRLLVQAVYGHAPPVTALETSMDQVRTGGGPWRSDPRAVGAGCPDVRRCAGRRQSDGDGHGVADRHGAELRLCAYRSHRRREWAHVSLPARVAQDSGAGDGGGRGGDGSGDRTARGHSARRMQTRGHRSMPRAASHSRILRRPGVSPVSSRRWNPHRV